jgi:hypothetical protein
MMGRSPAARPTAAQVCDVARGMVNRLSSAIPQCSKVFFDVSAIARTRGGWGALDGARCAVQPASGEGILEDLGVVGAGKYSTVHRARDRWSASRPACRSCTDGGTPRAHSRTKQVVAVKKVSVRARWSSAPGYRSGLQSDRSQIFDMDSDSRRECINEANLLRVRRSARGRQTHEPRHAPHADAARARQHHRV